MNKRVFNRNGYLYLDSQKDGIRQRISTSLKASVEANTFLAKKGVFELFFKDKTKALKMWRDYADVWWDKIQKSKIELAKEKLIKKGNERFFIKNIFESYEKEKSFLTKRTKINYKSAKLDIISFFETAGVFDLRELKREHIIDYILNLKERGLIKSTILNKMKFLKSFLNFCVENELLNKSPFFLPKITDLQENNIQEPFNLDEMQSLIKKAQGILRSYLIVAFFTGARTGEILGLKCGDLDFEKNKIHLQRVKHSDGHVCEGLKTSKYRIIDMLPLVKNELQNLTINLKKDDFVFSVRSEKLHKDFKTLCKELNLKERRLYNTRHSFASIMLSKGEEPMWVGVRMLGHSTLTTTYKYYAKYLPQKISARANFLNELDINQKTKAKNIS